MKHPIYMDYQATTPVDPAVLDAMLPFFSTTFGNPASRQHVFGWTAEAAVEAARTTIAHAIGAQPAEIIFTSGATEANNLAIKGIAEELRRKGAHIITVATEHKSVLDTCKRLERNGYTVTFLPVNPDGLIDLNLLDRSITAQTILVSVMAANNEIGTLQSIDEIGKICRAHSLAFHSDATQAVGKIPLNVQTSKIDLMSFTAHKMYGPKGIGALYVRNANPKIKIAMQMDGGGHERGMRSGTLNVPGIVGFGKAVEISMRVMSEESIRLREYRDTMLHEFTGKIDGVELNGHPDLRLPHNLNISFDGVEDTALMMSMREIAVSTGSACSTNSPEPSHVLKALGLSSDRIHSSIRFGLGRFTTQEEIEYTISSVVENVNKLRALSPKYKMAHQA